MRDQICSIGITVEVNPSSNLLIANLGDLLSHPLWRLRPPKQRNRQRSTGSRAGFVNPRNRDIGQPLPVCIGSDDPLTFATTLPDEYQFLHDALVRGGLSYDEASDWIDDVRRTGLQTRFTLPRPAGMPDIHSVPANIPEDQFPLLL